MIILGIDLGTTNTVVAKEGTVLPVDSDGACMLPSVVAFPPSGATLVGRKARRRRAIDPTNTIFSAKRLIGRTWLSEETKEFQTRYPLELIEADGAPCFKTRAGTFSPSQIGSVVLTAAHSCGNINPDDAMVVITVPTMFGQPHRDATLDAARRAGFHNVELINEPVAVARAYVNHLAQRPDLAAVYDFGGGTFDLAIVDCSKNPLQVVGHGGDLYLGGDDIDQKLAAWAAQEVLRRHGWDLRSDGSIYSRLVVECERAKIRLCSEQSTVIDLTQVDPAAPGSCRTLNLTAADAQKFASELVQRSFILCDEALHQAGLSVERIGAVFPAGGMTLLPTVKQGIEAYFRRPVEHIFSAMQVVAMGASQALDKS